MFGAHRSSGGVTDRDGDHRRHGVPKDLGNVRQLPLTRHESPDVLRDVHPVLLQRPTLFRARVGLVEGWGEERHGRPPPHPRSSPSTVALSVLDTWGPTPPVHGESTSSVVVAGRTGNGIESWGVGWMSGERDCRSTLITMGFTRTGWRGPVCDDGQVHLYSPNTVLLFGGPMVRETKSTPKNKQRYRSERGTSFVTLNIKASSRN